MREDEINSAARRPKVRSGGRAFFIWGKLRLIGCLSTSKMQTRLKMMELDLVFETTADC